MDNTKKENISVLTNIGKQELELDDVAGELYLSPALRLRYM